MVEVMRITVTSFRRVMHTLPHSVPLTLLHTTTDPHLRQRCHDTHRQVWVSLLWGHCSFLLGPGVLKVLFVPSKSQFPVLCKFWPLCGRVNGDLLQEGLAIPKEGTQPCPSERDPVSPSVSLFHQEAPISPLSLSIRGQIE